MRVRSDGYLLNFEGGAVLCQCELEVGNDSVPVSDIVAASQDFRLMGSRRASQDQTINESEMALFSECILECARKVLDPADIV
jgi:hypothetical protein